MNAAIEPSRLLLLFLTSAALPAALASPGVAQKHLELQDLVKLADIAFHGRVTGLRNEAVPEKRTAFTHVEFAIDRVLINRTGSALGARIELAFAGGTVGDEQVRFSHVPSFAVGDELVAFAQHDGAHYASPVLGGEQGLLRVVRDRRTGTPYPLLTGERGIAAVVKGSLAPADRVASIEAGVVHWKEPEPQRGPARPPAPTPVPGSGAVRAAESAALAANRPARLATIDDIAAGVEALARLPRNGTSGDGGGR